MKSNLQSHTVISIVIFLISTISCHDRRQTNQVGKIETLQQLFDHMERIIPCEKLAEFKFCKLDSAGTCVPLVHPFFKLEYEKLDATNEIHKDLESCRYFSDSLKILALEIRFHFYENGIYFETLDIRKIIFQMHDYRNGRPKEGFREILG